MKKSLENVQKNVEIPCLNIDCLMLKTQLSEGVNWGYVNHLLKKEDLKYRLNNVYAVLDKKKKPEIKNCSTEFYTDNQNYLCCRVRMQVGYQKKKYSEENLLLSFEDIKNILKIESNALDKKILRELSSLKRLCLDRFRMLGGGEIDFISGEDGVMSSKEFKKYDIFPKISDFERICFLLSSEMNPEISDADISIVQSGKCDFGYIADVLIKTKLFGEKKYRKIKVGLSYPAIEYFVRSGYCGEDTTQKLIAIDKEAKGLVRQRIESTKNDFIKNLLKN